jgi:hypothetical protein
LSDHSPFQSAKYEFASSNTPRTMFAFDACFVLKIAPLAVKLNDFFHRMSIEELDGLAVSALRHAIAEVKQCWSVMGWVTKNL